MTKYMISWFVNTEMGPQGPFSRNCKNNEAAANAFVDELRKKKEVCSIEKKTIEKICKEIQL